MEKEGFGLNADTVLTLRSHGPRPKIIISTASWDLTFHLIIAQGRCEVLQVLQIGPTTKKLPMIISVIRHLIYSGNMVPVLS